MKRIKANIKTIQRELDDHPEDPERLNELGVGYHLLGDYKRATEILKTAARLAPSNHQIQFNLGNSFAELENYEQSVHHLMRAIELKGDYVPAINNLADIYEHTGETDRAEELFQYITRIQPEDPLGFFNLGNFYLRQNDTVHAGKFYQKTLELNPEFYEAYNNIGFILKHLEQYTDAIPYFKQCLAINPDFTPAKIDLEECLRNVNGDNKT